MAERPKSSPLSTIMTVVTILAGIGFVIYFFMGPTDDPILKQLTTPRGAVQAYIGISEDFTSGQANFLNVEKVVTKADYRWFQENKDRIFAEHDTLANISSAADPTAVSAIAGHSLMGSMMKRGPYRRNRSEIGNVQESGSSAVVTVRVTEYYGEGEKSVTDIDIDVVKEGRYWRVKDFAGGRQYVEGTNPGNRRIVNTDELESAAPAMEIVSSSPAPAEAETPPSAPPQPAAPDAAPAPAPQPNGQVIAIQTPAGGTELDVNTASTLEDAEQLIVLAKQQWKEGKVQDAFKGLHKAYGIRTELLPADHEDVREVEAMLAQANDTLRRRQAQ